MRHGLQLLFCLFLFVGMSCGSSSSSTTGGNGGDSGGSSRTPVDLTGVDQSRRLLASNVVFASQVATDESAIDKDTKVLASNVVYEGKASDAEISSQNVEDALAETNRSLDKVVVGTWKNTNLGQNKSGTVTFRSDGTYTIDSGYFEAGGSWRSAPEQSGTYTIKGNVIAFKYSGWNEPALPISRFALVLFKRSDQIVLAVQGHTHGLEVLDRSQ